MSRTARKPTGLPVKPALARVVVSRVGAARPAVAGKARSAPAAEALASGTAAGTATEGAPTGMLGWPADSTGRLRKSNIRHLHLGPALVRSVEMTMLS